MSEDTTVELQIPCDPQQVSAARIFVASAGRQFGVDEEAIDDLKVAVSEACNGAIDANERNDVEGPMTISVEAHDESVEVRIASAGGSDVHEDEWDPATPTHLFQRTIGMGLVHGLFPDATWDESSSEGLRVTFRIPRSGAKKA